MPTLETVHLTFPGGLHVGTRGVNLEECGVSIPADTLFAALVDAHWRDGGDLDAWMQPFPRTRLSQAGTTAEGDRWEHQPGDVPFLLTTAFPYAGGVRFFPLPAPLRRLFTDETLKARRKDISAIRFVSEGILRRALDGQRLDPLLFSADQCGEQSLGAALQRGACWMLTEEYDYLPDGFRRRGNRRTQHSALRQQRVYATARVPRVTVSRVSSAAQVYHAGCVRFAPECGLWFGIQWRAPDASAGQATYRSNLKQLLALIGDEGLGGERTSGYGGFRHESGGTLSLPDPRPDGPMLLLSRYHPRADELPAALNDALAYALTPVAGWLRASGVAAQRRRRLWLVTEGSVIRAVGDAPWGDVVDVRPVYRGSEPSSGVGHPVWRYGLALGVGVEEARDG
jgi:CRISPR-associated protein Csm4